MSDQSFWANLSSSPCTAVAQTPLQVAPTARGWKSSWRACSSTTTKIYFYSSNDLQLEISFDGYSVKAFRQPVPPTNSASVSVEGFVEKIIVHMLHHVIAHCRIILRVHRRIIDIADVIGIKFRAHVVLVQMILIWRVRGGVIVVHVALFDWHLGMLGGLLGRGEHVIVPIVVIKFLE